jgi:diguanylate cyclase (GGDEF)-like protein
MAVEIKTLYTLSFILAFAMAGMAFFSWFHQRDAHGLRALATGLVLGAVGLVEMSLRTKTSPPELVIMANTLVIAGYATVWMALRRFNTGAPSFRFAIAPPALFLVAFTVLLLSGADVNHRVAFGSATIAILTLLCGSEVLRARRSDPLPSRAPTALAFFVMTISLTVRCIASLTSETPATTTPFYDPTQGVTLFANIVCVVALTLGFLMMTNERLLRHLESLASTDALTSLPNRRLLFEEGGRRNEAQTSVLMIDLDHFSEVNRTFGHAGGDRALIAFAETARRQLRGTDLIARYGGEEFCALLRGTDQAGAVHIAERVRESVEAMSIDVEGRPLKITVSIGVAPLEGDLRSAMRRADGALYRAKSLGRNKVCLASDDAA